MVGRKGEFIEVLEGCYKWRDVGNMGKSRIGRFYKFTECAQRVVRLEMELKRSFRDDSGCDIGIIIYRQMLAQNFEIRF